MGLKVNFVMLLILIIINNFDKRDKIKDVKLTKKSLV